jgi:hypothetical protein
MTDIILASWPNGKAFIKRAGRVMDVILHLGAHRTGSTPFQTYVRRSHSELSSSKLGYWGPQRTRQGPFVGIVPSPSVTFPEKGLARAVGRVRLQMARTAQSGVRKFLVSDESMTETVRHNLRKRALYSAIGERMAHFAQAFDGRLNRVIFNIRSHCLFWASSIVCGVVRGHRVLPPKSIENIANAKLTWRDVIADSPCAVPDTEIRVLHFERYQGTPDQMLAKCLDKVAPINTGDEWLNQAPNLFALRTIPAECGEIERLCAVKSQERAQCWVPFDQTQNAQLREAYADDMHRLISGADGLEILTKDTDHSGTGNIPQFGPFDGGQRHDKQKRHVAGHR